MKILKFLFGKRHPRGLVQQDVDNRDFKYRICGTSTEVKSVDLRDKFPNVTNQYDYNSCVAHAVCALVDYELKYNKEFTKWDFDSSEAFLWYWARYMEGKQTKNVGVQLRNAFKVVSRYGFIRQESWQYANGIYTKPNDRAIIEGQLFELYLNQLSEYCFLPVDKLFIKNALDNNHPVVFGFPVSNDFMYLEEYKFDGSILNIFGNHAMLIVGYDDEGVIVRNSWGLTWGEYGYCHITWSKFLTNAFDVWCLQDV